MIKGFRGTSLVDYPGKVASVVFTGGCNLRCPYCYNKELVLPELLERLPDISQDFVFNELLKRKNFIQAVVITGGEPTLHGEKLLDFLRNLRKLPFEVKLDTNGTFPHLLLRILEEKLVDFIAIDVKTSPSKYHLLGGEWEAVAEALNIVKKFDVVKEARITAVPLLVDEEMLREVAPFIRGMDRISVQRFINRDTLHPDWERISPYSYEELARLRGFVETLTA